MKVNSKNKLGIRGFDPVAFFLAETLQGKPEISYIHKDVRYFFKTAENREKFKKNPDLYLPEYGGFCAMSMSEGVQSDPNPKSFKIQNGKLYLFTMMFWGIIDVQRQWNKDPEAKRELADSEWAKMNQLVG